MLASSYPSYSSYSPARGRNAPADIFYKPIDQLGLESCESLALTDFLEKVELTSREVDTVRCARLIQQEVLGATPLATSLTTVVIGYLNFRDLLPGHCQEGDLFAIYYRHRTRRGTGWVIKDHSFHYYDGQKVYKVVLNNRGKILQSTAFRMKNSHGENYFSHIFISTSGYAFRGATGDCPLVSAHSKQEKSSTA